MSLPFLKPKPVAGLIVETRKADASKSTEDGDENAGLYACAEDLTRAIHAKDARSVAAALRAAFDILESMEEAPEAGSYDAQNAMATKEGQ